VTAPGASRPAPPRADQRSRPSADPDESPFAWAERLVSGYDLDGPRVRLGVAWFVVAVTASLLGMVTVALAFGLVAGAAGLQTTAAWRRAGLPTNRLLAGVGALALALSATMGIAFAGLTAIAFAAASFAVAVVQPSRRTPPLAAAGVTLRSGFFVGLAAASAVLIARTDASALVTLVVLVSGFEVGDYLVGTGSSNPAEGPLAGILAVLVLTFAVSVFEFPPFDWGSAWVFGGLAAALAPLGRFVASLLVPSPDARVPALKRLDSYLLVTPVWAWMLWSYLL
jgi:hypothetical protein